MDPTYLLLLIFVPVPVMLFYAIIVDTNDRKKKPNFSFNHFQSKKIPTESIGPKNQNIGQPSAAASSSSASFIIPSKSKFSARRSIACPRIP